MHMDKSNIYFSNRKKLRENARWNVNKTIRCLVRNKIKHRKVQDSEISDTLECRRFPYLVLPLVLDSIFRRSVEFQYATDQQENIQIQYVVRYYYRKFIVCSMLLSTNVHMRSSN